MNAEAITQKMLAAADPARAANMQRFFRCGPGQYGEGDRFLGLPNPAVRRLIASCNGATPQEALRLLQSPWHEIRLAGLLLLVRRFAGAEEPEQEMICREYLRRSDRINNWDLVDLSAPGIVGQYLLHRQRDRLFELAASSLLWDQRIAMVSTLAFIRHGDFSTTLKLAEIFLPHRHDLMHKATGWMLREVGKRDRALLTAFLERHKNAMPRTALRYAIEHYDDATRKRFLARS